MAIVRLIVYGEATQSLQFKSTKNAEALSSLSTMQWAAVKTCMRYHAHVTQLQHTPGIEDCVQTTISFDRDRVYLRVEL